MEWCAQVLKKGSKGTSESLDREGPPSRGEEEVGGRTERSYSLIDLFSKSVDSSGFSFSIVVDISSTEVEDFPLPTVYPW